MEQLSVYYCGEINGVLEINQDGLYLCVTAQCDPVETNEVLRLWAIGACEPEYLGIPLPEGECLVLRRRFPLESLHISAWTHCVLGTSPNCWQPFDGSFDGYAIHHGLRRRQVGKTEIALPFDPEKPIPFLPLLPRLRLERINESLWFVLQSDPEDT